MNQEKVCKLIDAVISNKLVFTNDSACNEESVLDAYEFLNADTIYDLMVAVTHVNNVNNSLLKLKLLLLLLSDQVLQDRDFRWKITACRGNIKSFQMLMSSVFCQGDIFIKTTEEMLVMKSVVPDVYNVLILLNKQIENVDFLFNGYTLNIYLKCKSIDYSIQISGLHS